MLTIEIALPSLCDGPVTLPVCAKLPDRTIYVCVRLCAFCTEPFIASRKWHRFCDARCKLQFNREKPPG